MKAERPKDVPTPETPNFLTRTREELMRLMGRIGDRLDAAVTWRDLGDIGLVNLPGGFGTGGGKRPTLPTIPGGGGPEEYEADLTPPPTPTGFKATGGITTLIVECDRPLYAQGHGHAHSVLYGRTVDRSKPNDPLPTFTDAVELLTFPGTVTDYSTQPGTTWRLWLKWKTIDGVESTDPAGGVNGLEVKTGEDVQLLLDTLKGKITESQLYQDLGTRIDLIDGEGPGSVNQRLTLVARTPGGTGNLLDNSEFATSLAGWYLGGPDPAQFPGKFRLGRNLSADWVVGDGVAFIEQADYQSGAVYSEASSDPIPFLPGKNAQWSIYTGAHRCLVEAFIYWRNAQGAIIGNTLQDPMNAGKGFDTNDAETLGGRTLSGYKRLKSFGLSPVGTATAQLIVRKRGTKAGATPTSSYAFFTRGYFAEAKEDQTEPDAYAPGGNIKALTAAIQQKMEVRADADGSLAGGYQFKIDLNGYVTGFGLQATGGGATPSSLFLIRAGTFAIASPTGPGIAPIIPFSVSTVAETINGVFVPAGVYMEGAYIKNGTITNAKIGNLAVDDAKIANLNVSKLTAGSLLVGSFIQSANYIAGVQGYRINGAGNVEFQEGVFRGTIRADNGYFAGELRAATGTFKGALSAATGDFAGSLSAATGLFKGAVLGGDFVNGNWPGNGGTGFYLDGTVFRMGNFFSGKYFELYATGDLYTPQFKIFSGNAEFSGELKAAKGTFSGALTADAVNAVQSINIAGGAVVTTMWTIADVIPAQNGSVSLGVSVPAGAVYLIVLRADFTGGIGSGNGATINLSGLPAPVQVPPCLRFFGGENNAATTYTRPPASIPALIYLSAGNHVLTASISDVGSSTCRILLTLEVNRRPA